MSFLTQDRNIYMPNGKKLVDRVPHHLIHYFVSKSKFPTLLLPLISFSMMNFLRNNRKYKKRFFKFVDKLRRSYFCTYPVNKVYLNIIYFSVNYQQYNLDKAFDIMINQNLKYKIWNNKIKRHRISIYNSFPVWYI